MEIKWSTITNADSGGPVELPHALGATITLSGTFGAAADFEIRGSDDNVTFSILNDSLGNALDAIAAATTVKVEELPRFIQVDRNGGDGTTDVDVTLTLRGCTN